MRGIALTSLAALMLVFAPGCDSLNQGRYPDRYAEYPEYSPEPVAAAPTAPRTNLYPLTTPPPGAARQMRGAAPTRIAATPPPEAYAPDPYARDPFPDFAPEQEYARAGYGGGMNNAPMNPDAPFDNAPYAAAPLGNTPGNVPLASAPLSAPMPTTPMPIVSPPVPAPPPAPAPQFAGRPSSSYAPPYTPPYVPPYASGPVPSPAAMSMAAGYGYDGRGGLGPYDTSSYGSPGVINDAGHAPTRQTYYDRVEGTADLAAASGIPIGPILPAPPPYGTPAPMPVPAAPAPSQTAPIPVPAPANGGYTGGAYPMATGAANVPASVPLTGVPGASGVANVPAGAAAYAADAVRLVPAPDIPPGNHPNDAGPSQWFEIIRPGNGALRIGRISATCVCVGVRVPKRQIAAGERALVEARILTRPQVNNLTYGIYVNLVEPIQTVVDADVTISL